MTIPLCANVRTIRRWHHVLVGEQLPILHLRLTGYLFGYGRSIIALIVLVMPVQTVASREAIK